MNPHTLSLLELVGVASVVTLTVLLVNVLKLALAETRAFARVPVMLYAAAAATALTLVAFGLGVFHGDVLRLGYQSVVHILMAVGVYELFRDRQRNLTAALGETFDAKLKRQQSAGRRPLTLAVAVALAVAALGSGGCNSALFNPNAKPLDRYTAVKVLYNTTNRALLAAKIQKRISQKTWDETVLPAMKLASAVFDEVEAKLAAGEKVDFDSVINVLNRYLDTLIDEEQKAKATNGSGNDPGNRGSPVTGPQVHGGLAPPLQVRVHARAA